MSDKIREAFEKFHAEHLRKMGMEEHDIATERDRLENGDYQWSMAAEAWPYWQAAASLAQQPAPVAQEPVACGGCGAADEAQRCVGCMHPFIAPPATDQPTGTKSDQYRAELYDEVWEKARSMGYGNVTDALADLERMKAAEQPGAAGMPLLHWYAMSFRDAGPNGEPVTASTNIGWPDQLITLPRIQEAKKGALVGQNAVMLACCYLGHATRSQILGKEGKA